MYDNPIFCYSFKVNELDKNLFLQIRRDLEGLSKLVLHICSKFVGAEWQLGDHSTPQTMSFRTRHLSQQVIWIKDPLRHSEKHKHITKHHISFNFFNDSSFTHRLGYNASRGTVTFPPFCFSPLSFYHSASQSSCLVYWFRQVPMPAQAHTYQDHK